jgi:hypothetical protein
MAAAVAGFASLVVGLFIREHVSFSWWRATMAAMLLALISALGVGLVTSGRRMWCLAGFVLAVPMAATIDVFVLGDWMYVDELLSIYRHPSIRADGLTALVWVYALLAGWSIMLAIVTPAWQPADQPRILRRLLRVVSLVPAVSLTLLLVCVYWRMLNHTPQQADADSRENVYPRVLALAEGIESASPSEASATYAELLPLLARPGHVVLDWDNAASHPGAQRRLRENAVLYNLVHSLRSQSDLHRSRGQIDESAKYAEGALEVSRIASTGGIVCLDPPGQVAFNIGLVPVVQLRRSLSPQQAGKLARLLESLEHDREPAETTIQRDVMWRAKSRRWRYELERALYGDLIGMDIAHMPYSRANEGTMRELRCMGNLVSIDLALRAYRADHGGWPARLDELCPAYLNSIPVDPLSGKFYVYRSAEPEFVLYSVGKDGNDNQGRFGNPMRLYGSRRIHEGYDIDADTFVRP